MVDRYLTADNKIINFPTRGNRVKIDGIWQLRENGPRILRDMGIKAKMLPAKNIKRVFY